jgi:hypothetical protein
MEVKHIVAIILLSLIAVLFLLGSIYMLIDYISIQVRYRKRMKQIHNYNKLRTKAHNAVYCYEIALIYNKEHHNPQDLFCDSWIDYYLKPMRDDDIDTYHTVKDFWKNPHEYDIMMVYLLENIQKEEFVQWLKSRSDIYLSAFSDFI